MYTFVYIVYFVYRSINTFKNTFVLICNIRTELTMNTKTTPPHPIPSIRTLHMHYSCAYLAVFTCHFRIWQHRPAHKSTWHAPIDHPVAVSLAWMRSRSGRAGRARIDYIHSIRPIYAKSAIRILDAHADIFTNSTSVSRMSPGLRRQRRRSRACFSLSVEFLRINIVHIRWSGCCCLTAMVWFFCRCIFVMLVCCFRVDLQFPCCIGRVWAGAAYTRSPDGRSWAGDHSATCVWMRGSAGMSGGAWGRATIQFGRRARAAQPFEAYECRDGNVCSDVANRQLWKYRLYGRNICIFVDNTQ